MKRVKLIIGIIIVYLTVGCRSNREFTELKKNLFQNESGLDPIYADPPTGDYTALKEGKFNFQIDSSELEKINRYQKKLAPIIVKYIDSSYAWVYLAAYLKLESAVPELKKALLKCDRFYGWEGGNYENSNRYLEDEQYCFQLAYIAAIEYITGKPLHKAITLLESEYETLKAKSEKCNMNRNDSLEAFCPSKWLFDKLINGEK